MGGEVWILCRALRVASLEAVCRPEVIPGTMFQAEGTACAKALRWAVLVSEEPQGPRPVCAMGTGWAGVVSATVKTWAFTWRLKASCQSKCF